MKSYMTFLLLPKVRIVQQQVKIYHSKAEINENDALIGPLFFEEIVRRKSKACSLGKMIIFSSFFSLTTDVQ